MRNHPLNTLVREYYCKADLPPGQRPHLLGVLSSHLHARHRLFDRTRQHIRKLGAALQSVRVVLPSGAGAAAMARALHGDPIELRAVEPPPAEAALAAALQGHCLALWDLLHDHQLNIFGR